jgi:hypothetical protein
LSDKGGKTPKCESAELELFVMDDVTTTFWAEALEEEKDREHVSIHGAGVSERNGGMSVPKARGKRDKHEPELEMDNETILEQLAATDVLNRAWYTTGNK